MFTLRDTSCGATRVRTGERLHVSVFPCDHRVGLCEWGGSVHCGDGAGILRRGTVRGDGVISVVSSSLYAATQGVAFMVWLPQPAPTQRKSKALADMPRVQ
jgi:hypothetical protein